MIPPKSTHIFNFWQRPKEIKILPDLLQKITEDFFDRVNVNVGCPKKLIITIYSKQFGQVGEVHVFLVNEHSPECKKFASQGLICQVINPQLRTWVLTNFENGVTLSRVATIIENKELHSKFACPVPESLGPGSRYRPSLATLRSIMNEARRTRLVDDHEAKAVALLVEELKQSKSIVYYNSGICTCEVRYENFHYPCLSNKHIP